MARVIENQPAYILHRRLYRNSSYLLDVFTLDFGRLTIVAKGAARGKKNWSALLQMFQPLLIDWTGRSSLKTLVNVEAPVESFNLVSRYLYCGFYLNELILKLCPEMDSNPELFACYGDTLPRLNKQCHIEAVLRQFEFQLLTILGFAPDFSHSVSGQSIESELRYVLTNDAGFIELQDSTSQHGGISESVLISNVEGATLLHLAHGWFAEHRDGNKELGAGSKQTFRQAKILMRQLIDRALQGRELKSRELFQQIVRGE